MKGPHPNTVAVIGAGTMGQGIAQVFAQGGCSTILYDVNPQFVRSAVAAIEKNLQVAVEKSKITEIQKIETCARIRSVNELRDVRADLIIEAIVERLEAKRQLFLELEAVNSRETVFATNTSSLSITEIASGLINPANCIGLHFFNPAHIMKLVEIISGDRTRAGLAQEMKILVEHLGKIPVLVKDSPGFIVNRVARHFYLESLKLLDESEADIEGIDKLLRASGFKLGPFELMDLIGIDINYAVSKSVYNGFRQASRFKPSKIQEEKVKAGHLGRKSGTGFYEYSKS